MRPPHDDDPTSASRLSRRTLLAGVARWRHRGRRGGLRVAGALVATGGVAPRPDADRRRIADRRRPQRNPDRTACHPGAGLPRAARPRPARRGLPGLDAQGRWLGRPVARRGARRRDPARPRPGDGRRPERALARAGPAPTADIRAAAGRTPVIAIDQEGGLVTRLSPAHGYPAVASEAEIGSGTDAHARRWAKALAATLADAGVTLNLAPVVDLDVNPTSPAIGALGRSFSADADTVVRMAGIEVAAHRAAGVATALKHFPGIGSSTGNTDNGVVDVTRTWHRAELEPFQRLIEADRADVVMVGHVRNDKLDPHRPASQSRAVVTDLLRGTLGWEGVVVNGRPAGRRGRITGAGRGGDPRARGGRGPPSVREPAGLRRRHRPHCDRGGRGCSARAPPGPRHRRGVGRPRRGAVPRRLTPPGATPRPAPRSAARGARPRSPGGRWR